ARLIFVMSRFAERPLNLALEAEHLALALERDEVDVALLPGLEAHRGSGGDREAVSVRALAVERERVVRLVEVVVRPDLDRPVARVRDRDADRRTPGAELEVAVDGFYLTGDHRVSPHGIGL